MKTAAPCRALRNSPRRAITACLALATLVWCTTASAQTKVALEVQQVRAVFELVRMHKIFDIYGTKEEAARAFGAS
jgi:hypothetical protein